MIDEDVRADAKPIRQISSNVEMVGSASAPDRVRQNQAYTASFATALGPDCAAAGVLMTSEGTDVEGGGVTLPVSILK